jgi:phosphoglycerate dehydrogenase-like enzyme
MHGPGWADLRVAITGTGMAGRLAGILDGTPGLRVAVTDGDTGGADVVIGFLFPPGSLAAARELRWLHLTGAGTDHLARAGLSPEVVVTTSAVVPVTAVAEYALAGLMLLAKDLTGVAARQPRDWFGSSATLLADSTVAVVGAGRIGRAVLARAGALGARTIAVTRPGAPGVAQADDTIGTDALAARAPTVDHLVACLPRRPDTARLVGAAVLRALPAHATVVNVGRAETVDTAALYELLHAGRLRGAFLDVHETEPLPPGDPAWSVPRLVISPHCAFAFPEEPARVAEVFLANLGDLRHGRTPRDLAAWHDVRIT